MKLITLIAVVFTTIVLPKTMNAQDNYVVEITTFNVKSAVNLDSFWVADAKIQETYTSKQPGFISRESAISDDNEILVLVKWESNADAEASMQKFMGDTSVVDYVEMIDGPSMKMKRYTVE